MLLTPNYIPFDPFFIWGFNFDLKMWKWQIFYVFTSIMQRADSLEKNPDAGKDWRWEEKGRTEDEMVGWHHWLDGHGSGWTLEVGDRLQELVMDREAWPCCGSWGRKESDTTEWLNWTELPQSKTIWIDIIFPDFDIHHFRNLGKYRII